MKEKIRTEQLYCDHKDGCLRPFSTKIVTKCSQVTGRFISFLMFNSILNLEKNVSDRALFNTFNTRNI